AALIWENWLKCFFPNVNEKVKVLITKCLSALVSIIVIGAAFLCMRIGTIFEAIFVLIDASTGPLFGLFTLGVCFPYVNVKGAISGLIFGLSVALWITVGSLINKNEANLALPVTNNGCELGPILNTTGIVSFSEMKNYRIPSYYPNGWNYIYHLSPFLCLQ
ncbi:sodium-dependent multivitamin transporter-like isoform X2, partial [Leptotrombidium deliense]